MIVDALFSAVHLVLSPIFALLPTFSIATTLGLDVNDNWFNHIGSVLGSWERVFPISFLVSMIKNAYVVLLSCFVTYKVANWIWRHIPSVGGFGTGAG